MNSRVALTEARRIPGTSGEANLRCSEKVHGGGGVACRD